MLGSSSRFLTLITTDGGSSYGFDQTLFGNPILNLSAVSSVSAPGTIAFLGLGLVGMGMMRRRKSV